MSDSLQSESLPDVPVGRQTQAAIVLLSSTLLMITWKYFGSRDFFLENLSEGHLLYEDRAYSAAIYTHLAAFLLLAVVPLLVVKFVLRHSLREYGLRVGDFKKGALAVLLLGPVFVLVGYSGSGDGDIREYYPVNPDAQLNYPLHAVMYVLFFLSWEFHFRGYLQIGLREPLGRMNAILVQVMASTLIHIGTPACETYMAIAGGLIWAGLAYRTRSLWPGVILHAAMGLTVDYLLVYGG